jgi:SPP1 family predicted phage head-tail adaptor
MKKETINSGNFNEQITWKAPTATKDSFGQTTRSFATYKTDFAEVTPVSIDEMPVASRVQYTETYSFTTFYDSAINSKYQILYNAENYNILKIEKLNMFLFMRVTAIKIED